MLSDKFGLLNIETLAKGPLNIGDDVPDRRNGELFGTILVDTGDTCQMLGGGGVSQRLLDEVLRLPPPGGVPITNCTEGGDIELMSISLLAFLLLIPIGADLGMGTGCK